MDEREDTIHLELDREDAPEVVDVLLKRRTLLDEEIKKRQSELDVLISKATRLGFILEKLNGPAPTISLGEETIGKKRNQDSPRPINGYNAGWTVWEKVQYVLRKQIEPISKAQIVEAIASFEPRIASLSGKKKRSFSVSISATLTTKYQLGKLGRVESDTDDNKYLLNE